MPQRIHILPPNKRLWHYRRAEHSGVWSLIQGSDITRIGDTPGIGGSAAYTPHVTRWWDKCLSVFVARGLLIACRIEKNEMDSGRSRK